MSLDNSISEIIKNTNSIKKLQQNMKDFFDASRLSLEENINILLNYGWYISGDIEMKAISKFNQLIKSEKYEEAEKLMISFYKKNITKLKAKIISKYPERGNIIEEAFKAHKKGMFNSSTILFFISS